MGSTPTAMKSSPRSLQPEKAHMQQQRPNAAKNKISKFILKKSIWEGDSGLSIINLQGRNLAYFAAEEDE